MKQNLLSSLLFKFTVISITLAAGTSIAAPSGELANYKGEAPALANCGLRDGFYIGAAGGYDGYKIDNDISIPPILTTAPFLTMTSAPHMSVDGGVGGLFIGYGKYFDRFHNTYLGLEVFGDWSGASRNNNLPLGTNVVTPGGTYLISQELTTKVKVRNNYGISLLPGIKLYDLVLLYVRLGYNWANISVNQTINNTANFDSNVGVVTSAGSETLDFHQTSTVSGFNYGLGLETELYGQLSLRAEYTHTKYNSFHTSLVSTRITATDNQYMLGVIYHI
jgi:opacity protein-like surface antigen